MLLIFVRWLFVACFVDVCLVVARSNDLSVVCLGVVRLLMVVCRVMLFDG